MWSLNKRVHGQKRNCLNQTMLHQIWYEMHIFLSQLWYQIYICVYQSILCRNTEEFVWIYLIFTCAVAAVSVVVLLLFLWWSDELICWTNTIICCECDCSVAFISLNQGKAKNIRTDITVWCDNISSGSISIHASPILLMFNSRSSSFKCQKRCILIPFHGFAQTNYHQMAA